MEPVGNLLVPSVKATYFSVAFTLIYSFNYLSAHIRKFAAILKLPVSRPIVYLLVHFCTKQNLPAILKATLSQLSVDKNSYRHPGGNPWNHYSPYLFFLADTMEAEDMKSKEKYLMVNKKICGK